MYDGLTLSSFLARWRPFLEGSKVIDLVILDACDRETNAGLEEELRRGAATVLVLSRQGRERELVFVNPGARAGLFLWQKSGLRRAKPHSRRRRQEAAFLRRRLAGAVLLSTRQHGRDRVVSLELAGSDELGEPLDLALHVCLTGRRANLVLESAGRVVNAWRPGPRYGEPFRPAKSGAATVGEYLEGRREGTLAPRRKRSLAGELVAGVDGISSTAVAELFRRVGLAPDVVCEQLDAEVLRRLAAESDRLIASAGEVRFHPAERVLSCLPLAGLGGSRPATEEDEAALVAHLEREHRREALVARLQTELNRMAGR
ncbi:MAG TPA: hypothetical protein ENN88_03540, partial [Candidatus Coatesbacteria bacterium]|nr:hypothetical protein [Candidatus Coatesbacteria bacterium]